MQLCTISCEKKLQKYFYALGLFIGRRPWHIIIGVIAVIALSAVGFLNFEQNNNTKTEFTPTNAPSRNETAVIEKFLQQNGTLSIVRLIIQAKDGGSLLRPRERHESLSMTHALHSQLKVCAIQTAITFFSLSQRCRFILILCWSIEACLCSLITQRYSFCSINSTEQERRRRNH